VHFLGDDSDSPTRPSKRHFEARFRLEEAPKAADLLVEVLHLQGPEDGIAEQLKQGESRTEVRLNGKPVDYLNRYVDRAQHEPRTLRLKLRANLLQVGDNQLEIRQLPRRDTGKCIGCDILKVHVEVPD
jgi:hypothetical protein